MITGELKSKVDRIWDTMWSGGISNPLSVIEQLTYLLFIKRLDELQTLKESKAARTGKPIEDPIFKKGQDALRWSPRAGRATDGRRGDGLAAVPRDGQATLDRVRAGRAPGGDRADRAALGILPARGRDDPQA